jgi:CRP/FNR family cyclic AMP-dependent transcriptional regulator
LIIEEGKHERWVYFLVSGRVRVVKHGMEINILDQAGDVFGEMAILDGTARSASIYAIDETVCLATDASYLDRLSDNDRNSIHMHPISCICRTLIKSPKGNG